MKRFNFLQDNTENVPQKDYNTEPISGLGKLIIFLPFFILIFVIYIMSSSNTPTTPMVDPNLQENLSNTVALYKQKQTYIDSLVSKMPDLEKEQDLLNKDINELSTSYNSYINTDLAVFLKSMSKNIPVAMALTLIKIDQNKIFISGIARDTDTIMTFIDKLLSNNIVKILNIKHSKYTDNFGPYKQEFALEGSI